MPTPSVSSTPASATSRRIKKKPGFSKPQELVTIISGNGVTKKSLLVHKEFACHYSPVFKAAFESGFVEGQTQTYRLDDAEEITVRLLVHWFYTQEIDLAQIDDWNSSENKTRYLVPLWALADKLLILRLKK